MMAAYEADYIGGDNSLGGAGAIYRAFHNIQKYIDMSEEICHWLESR